MLAQAPLLGAQRGISVVRLVGGSLIALVWLMALGSIAVVFYEYALPRTKSAKELPLTRAGYYKTARPGDPYTPFTTQHLHPIYLLFFPLAYHRKIGGFSSAQFKGLWHPSNCHENCLDYSNLFDNQFAEIPVFRGTEETRNPESLIFADIIHLLDSGNEYVARHLVQDLGLRAIASP
jgi:hypothetical protein